MINEFCNVALNLFVQNMNKIAFEQHWRNHSSILYPDFLRTTIRELKEEPSDRGALGDIKDHTSAGC